MPAAVFATSVPYKLGVTYAIGTTKSLQTGLASRISLQGESAGAQAQSRGIWSDSRWRRTMTSNCCGFETSCMQQLSTITSLYLIPGYRLAISRQDSKNSPSASFIMLALWTAVTVFRLLRYAYSNAYFAMRSEQNFVITYEHNEVRLSIAENTYDSITGRAEATGQGGRPSCAADQPLQNNSTLTHSLSISRSTPSS